MSSKSALFYLFAVATVIAAIGAINWGLVGLTKYNAVAYITNDADGKQIKSNTFSKGVYVLVGVAGAAILVDLFMRFSEGSRSSLYAF